MLFQNQHNATTATTSVLIVFLSLLTSKLNAFSVSQQQVKTLQQHHIATPPIAQSQLPFQRRQRQLHNRNRQLFQATANSLSEDDDGQVIGDTADEDKIVIEAPQNQVEVEPRAFIDIYNPLKNTSSDSDRLPVSYTSSWPTYVLNVNTNVQTNTKNQKEESSKATTAFVFERIPDDTTTTETKESDDDDPNFIQPTSIDELWQPVDIQYPYFQLSVGVHIRDGTIRHVLPSMDVTTRPNTSDNNNVIIRNRGMCSVPRAYNWIDFNSIMADIVTATSQYSLRLDVLVPNDDSTNDKKNNAATTSANTEYHWKTIETMSSKQVGKSIQNAIYAISQGDPPQEMSSGSCIVNIVEDGTLQQQCPKETKAVRVQLLDNAANEEEQDIGELNVLFKIVEAGSKSEYMPDGYKSIYGPDSKYLDTEYLNQIQYRF